VRDDLPSSTVTFLFTDVESSARLPHELGAERYAAALSEHRRVIREACVHRDGLHTGTPLLTDEGYVGDDVHLGARVAAPGTAARSFSPVDGGAHRAKRLRATSVASLASR
jgi:class 3 adenylate cyclase